MGKTHYDIIIIGTGIGGGTMARELATTGESILIVERGDFIPKEKETWDPVEIVEKGRYRAKEKWLDKDDNLFDPFTHYVVRGNSKVYGAAAFRFKKSFLIPCKRVGVTSDIGNMPVLLCSDLSDYVHGATIFVDGGMTLYPGFEENG